MSFSDNVKTLFSELQKSLSTRTVVGEPITIDDKILIPVVKASMGAGLGSGRGGGKGEKGRGSEGEGAGGGGGISVTPVAFIAVFKGVKGLEGVKVLPVKEGAGFSKFMESMPEVMAKGMEMAKEMKGEKGKGSKKSS